MPYLTPYHVSEQQASVLLGPISEELRQLEQRCRHYVERVNLMPGAAEPLSAAHELLERTRAEIERLAAAAAEAERQGTFTAASSAR